MSTEPPDIAVMLKELHHPALPTIDLSLARMERFMERLGSPQNRLPPVIHVAGTNGKGSLVAYLQAIFQAAGLRVHRYISPHLVRFNERIVLAGAEISDDTLREVLRDVQVLSREQPVTFFEATTAAAFLAFAAYEADILLLEVGLGGRLDATNIVQKPLLTAITPVSLDHCNFLGDTLEKIAAEKAGILKTGVSCVVGPQEAATMQIIEHIAAKVGAPLYRYGHEWNATADAAYTSVRHKMTFMPSLEGVHQVYNAATAIACIESIPKLGISETAIQRGIATARWPARLQRLETGKLSGLLAVGSELWLDGGHNPGAGKVLAAWAAARQSLPLVVVCGMLKDKDTLEFLRPLAPYVHYLYGIAIPDEPLSQLADSIVQTAQTLGIPAQVAASVEDALRAAGTAFGSYLALICGSLYLAGNVLSSPTN